MNLKDLVTDLLVMEEELGTVELTVAKDLYFCVVDGKLAILTEPTGTVVYMLNPLKMLN